MNIKYSKTNTFTSKMLLDIARILRTLYDECIGEGSTKLLEKSCPSSFSLDSL